MLHVVSALFSAFGLMASLFLIGSMLRRNAELIVNALRLQTGAYRHGQSHFRIVASQNNIFDHGQEIARTKRATVGVDVHGSNRSQRAA